MGEMIKTGESGLVSALHGEGGLVIPKPFEHDIMLFETHVAGTMHVPGIEELEPQLEIGERLSFYREPNNPYDEKAIVVKTASGTKIGYVPRKDNVVFARLMDAGKMLFGRIKEKEIDNGWVKITMEILLHE